KWQWEIIRYPALFTDPFGGDEEGEYGSDGYNILLNMLRQADINTSVFMKKCEDNQTSSPSMENSRIIITISGKKYYAIQGKYDKTSDIITFEEGTRTVNNSNITAEWIDKQISDNDKIIFNVFSENSIQACQPKNNYDNFCELWGKGNLEKDTDFLTKWANDINNCQQTKMSEIANTIQERINKNLYSDISICVKLNSTTGENFKLTSKNIQNEKDADIDFEININPVDELVINASVDIKDDFLSEYVSKLQQEANARGIDVNIEELRKEVINNIEEELESLTFLEKAWQETSAFFSSTIGDFVESALAIGKVSKNVFNYGEINKSTWHSTDEHAQKHAEWPAFMQVNPVIGGIIDGGLDQITSIPLLIKALYGIVTDSEERKAFLGMFSAEGAKQMLNALKETAIDIANDEEKLQHFGSRAVVNVVSLAKGLSLVTKQNVKSITNAENLVSPKTSKIIKTLEEKNKYKPDMLKELKKVLDDVDPATLEKLADIENFDKVLEDMVTHWNKFKGGKFQLEYAKNLIGEGKTIKFEVSDLSDNIKRIYDIEYYEVLDGVPHPRRLELKSWDNFYPETVKSQFVKDLQKMENAGNIQWIFNKTNTISDMQTLKAKVISALKKADGSPIDEIGDLVNKGEFQSKIKMWMNISDDVTSSEFVDWLNDSNIFDKIFEVVE
ncbi:MAG: hypothetical protein LBE13_04320, partial [Bacteroidales bacterium]|nr:hypothetical protein [Bacteroidales bacterium]